MLDPEDGDALALQDADHVREFDDLGVGQPAGDLVEEQDARIGRQGARQFEALCDATGE